MHSVKALQAKLGGVALPMPGMKDPPPSSGSGMKNSKVEFDSIMSQFDTQRKSSLKDTEKVQKNMADMGVKSSGVGKMPRGSKISALKGKLGGIPMPGAMPPGRSPGVGGTSARKKSVQVSFWHCSLFSCLSSTVVLDACGTNSWDLNNPNTGVRQHHVTI